MSTDRQVADAARAYVAARIALQDDSVPSTMTATVLIEDLAWYLLVQLVTADDDTIVDTAPL